MKYRYLLLLSIFVLSCGNNQDKEKIKKPKPLMSLVKTHTATENVKPIFLKEVDSWGELKAIDSFFVKFRKISPNEALSNAVELKSLIKSLKENIKPDKFNILSLEARINILYNEVLRLADLIEIGAIKAEEVNIQVDKTMSAFSDVNTKINTILTKINFENEIDIDVKFIGLDTTRIDSISKKSIDLRLKEQVMSKNKVDKISNNKEQ
ncbi:hypothetical protein [Polaribacter sp. ALD11]|uniref:hypothetical protein n=1 Tax=Polaribacter sp. ALD11 TaxID=2058137 RepID=UPI0012FD8B3A|nr:hypothetical protein [Polaribacter sp. ALD11]